MTVFFSLLIFYSIFYQITTNFWNFQFFNGIFREILKKFFGLIWQKFQNFEYFLDYFWKNSGYKLEEKKNVLKTLSKIKNFKMWFDFCRKFQKLVQLIKKKCHIFRKKSPKD